MYDRIALATDRRADARKAASFAVRLAARHEATLHVVSVDTKEPLVIRLATTGVANTDRASPARPGTALVSTVQEEASAEGIDCKTARADGRLDRAVSGYIHAHDIDHVVVARASRRGMLNWLAAGARGKLVRRIDVPITFVGDTVQEPSTDTTSGQSVQTPSVTIE